MRSEFKQSKLCRDIILGSQATWLIKTYLFYLVMVVWGFSPTLSRGAACCCISALSEAPGGGGEAALTCPHTVTGGHPPPKGHRNPLAAGMWLGTLPTQAAMGWVDAAMAPGSRVLLTSISYLKVGEGFSPLFLELYTWQLMSVSNRTSF